MCWIYNQKPGSWTISSLFLLMVEWYDCKQLNLAMYESKLYANLLNYNWLAILPENEMWVIIAWRINVYMVCSYTYVHVYT